MFQITPLVRNLLIINVVIFLLSIALPFANINDTFSLHSIYSDHFAIYQLITHMFLHGSFGHLFSNMFTLFMFGTMLEMAWGPRKFLIFYMVCGIGGGVLYGLVNTYEIYELKNAYEIYLASPDPDNLAHFLRTQAPSIYKENLNIIELFAKNPHDIGIQHSIADQLQLIFNSQKDGLMLGASGAVFGLLLAFGVTFPDLELMIFPLFIPVKAKYLVFIYGAIELFTGLYKPADDGVAHFAHLGGMFFGFILLAIWKKNDKK